METNSSALNFDYRKLIIYALIFAVFYFFMIRPQKKKQEEQKQYIEQLKKGDKVMTVGGLYGIVYEVFQDTIVIEVDKCKMEFAKNAIVYNPEKKQK